MKDTSALLKEFNIEAEICDKKQPDSKEKKAKEVDPYDIVEALLDQIDINDIETSRIVLVNQINESLLERDHLVRNNFTTYIKCRKALESMEASNLCKSTLKNLDMRSVNSIEILLEPIILENKEIHLREQQNKFMLSNSLLFNAEFILLEYLKINDFDSFLTDYKMIKAEVEKFKDSRFVSYLFSKVVPILARFKIEVIRRIETCKSISESLHYFRIYTQVDSESYHKAFATLLTIAKTEIGERQIHPGGTLFSKLRNIKGFVADQTESILYMIDAMKAVDMVTWQAKEMTDFVVSAADAYAASIKRGLLDFLKEDTSEAEGASLDLKEKLSIIHEISQLIEAVTTRMAAEGIEDAAAMPSINEIFSLLIKILWRGAEKESVQNISGLIRDTQKVFGLKEHISKEIKEFLIKPLSRSGNITFQEWIEALAKVTVEIFPKVENFLSDAEKQEVLDKVSGIEEKIREIGAAHLESQLEEAASDEELLMALVKVKVLFSKNGLHNNPNEYEIISEAVNRIDLTTDLTK
ncbi:hypothetical protein NEAUS03_1482, partial [Nematocida ausubeli]